MINVLRRYNIPLQFLLLIAALWSLSLYNYISQKRVFLQQMQRDSNGLFQSVRSSLMKFSSIQSTLSLQSLVEDISLKLDIFEFRYLDKNGITVSSMFKEEVGKVFQRPGIELALNDDGHLGVFYQEERDLTRVMAISYPVSDNGEFLGIIDLAVDIGELEFVSPATREQLLRRMKLDIGNLVNAIAGSIVSRTRVFHTVDLIDFLQSLVLSSNHVMRISLLEEDGSVSSSSDISRIGSQVEATDVASGSLVTIDGKPLYLLTEPLHMAADDRRELLIYLDASDYVANERKLFYTAVASSLLGIVFALAIAYAIYRINLRHAREENFRLERMVQDRTAEIERISKTDKLTGLFNRCALEEQLLMEFKRARRYQHELSLIVVDLDYFKQVNDRYGHLAGDAVLSEIGQRLRQKLRETDFIGRFGGEEFVVILPETELRDALYIGDELRRLVAAEPVQIDSGAVLVTVSLGVASMGPEHHDYKGIFAQADYALYHAKNSGRNRVTYFNGEVPVEFPRGEDLVASVHLAID